MAETSTAHACPTCTGTGLVSRPPHIPGDVPSWTASDSRSYPCRACSGSGIVWNTSNYVQVMDGKPSPVGVVTVYNPDAIALATLREAVREWLAAKAAHTKAILDYFHHADGASVVVIRDKLAVEESIAARLRELATPRNPNA